MEGVHMKILLMMLPLLVAANVAMGQGVEPEAAVAPDAPRPQTGVRFNARGTFGIVMIDIWEACGRAATCAAV